MKTEKKIFGQIPTEYAIAIRKYDYDIDIIKDTITSDLNKIKEEFKNKAFQKTSF